MYLDKYYPNLILDDFTDEYYIDGEVVDAKFTDNLFRDITDYFKKDFNYQTIEQNLKARVKSRDLLKELYESYKWDGISRLEKAIEVFNCDYEEMHARLFKKFIVQTAARGLQPGCVAQLMLVLQGEQGCGKTFFVNNYTEILPKQIPNITENAIEAMRSLKGKHIIEIGELSSVRKADNNVLKNFISESVDNYRPLFRNTQVSVPRRCVFIGTTNEEEFLTDTTGNRRYFVLKCGKIDTNSWIKIREQLFAEAVHLIKEGYNWTLTEEENKWLNKENDKNFKEVDELTEIVLASSEVQKYETNLSKGISIAKIKEQYNIPLVDKKSDFRIANILKSNNFTKKKTSSCYLWVKESK